MQLFATGIILVTGYSILVVQFYEASKKGCNSTTDAVVKGCSLAVLNQRHLIGIVAMLLPVLYVAFTNRNWLLVHPSLHVSVLWITMAAGSAACILSLAAARKALRTATSSINTSSVAGTYLLLRCVFLICYELFFRGLLLSFCLQWTPAPVAVAINMVLYALAHAFSTRQELLGTVPFGILLCLLTLYAGSVWPAVLIHLLLGLPYDVWTLSASRRALKTLHV